MRSEHHTIWTIGHSTRTMEEFIAILQSVSIKYVVDVRHYPGSRKFPWFNKEVLAASLAEVEIFYTHIESLGGRRKPQVNSKNAAWRHPAFRGYADYMETPIFHEGIVQLKAIGEKIRTAYMCSEAVWWRCHRSMISDYLKAEGWKVLHILAEEKVQEHPFTAPARIVDGKLSYVANDLFET